MKNYTLLSALMFAPALAFAQSAPKQSVVVTPVMQTPGQVAAPGTLPPLPRQVLVPFRATYTVTRNGSAAGVASMQVLDVGGGRWRLDLGIRGTQGLAGIAGLNLQQSTVFERVGDQFRPITISTHRNLLMANKRSLGVYDWARMTATWTGDVSDKRKVPVALQPGDMNALLVLLAAVRDTGAGKTLSYRLVDNGRARLQTYVTAPAQVTVQAADLSYEAWHVSRANGGDDGMDVYISDNVPTPVRITQRDSDIGTLELTLTEYKGMPK